jgi:hypothetical protein
MDTPPHQPSERGSKTSRLAGTSSNMSLIGRQQECRQQLVLHNAANAANEDITQDAHLQIVCRTGSSTNKNQYAAGCEYTHTVVNGRQFIV